MRRNQLARLLNWGNAGPEGAGLAFTGPAPRRGGKIHTSVKRGNESADAQFSLHHETEPSYRSIIIRRRFFVRHVAFRLSDWFGRQNGEAQWRSTQSRMGLATTRGALEEIGSAS